MAGRKSMGYDGAVQRRNMSDAAPLEGDVVVLRDKGGYDPARLDTVIARFLKNAADGARLVELFTPMLDGLMQQVKLEVEKVQLTFEVMREAAAMPMADGTIIDVDALKIGPQLDLALRLSERISVVLDRLNKMVLNANKTLDDATRLRTFLATGGDEDPDGLDKLSESQLRRIVNEAAGGWERPALDGPKPEDVLP